MSGYSTVKYKKGLILCKLFISFWALFYPVLRRIDWDERRAIYCLVKNAPPFASRHYGFFYGCVLIGSILPYACLLLKAQLWVVVLVAVPFWLAALLAPPFVARKHIAEAIRTTLRRSEKCITCGYNLTGQTVACPECGTSLTTTV